MRSTIKAMLLMAATGLGMAGASLASGAGGGAGIPQGAPGMPSQSPEALAVQSYNRALHYRNKAWKLEEKVKGEPGALDAKTAAKVQAQFEKMIAPLEKAVKNKPDYYEAYSSLGYALRRTGDYEASLAAYDRSLALNPNYPEAIEYRAEAYLALNRPEDAKAAYLRLKLFNAEKADELLEAFHAWVRDRRHDPAGMAVSELEQIAEWVAGQSKIASIDARLATSSENGSW
ncbi:MAG: tetratricopeptide repeat protein [Thermoanaerobaculia bacterium]